MILGNAAGAGSEMLAWIAPVEIEARENAPPPGVILGSLNGFVSQEQMQGTGWNGRVPVIRLTGSLKLMVAQGLDYNTSSTMFRISIRGSRPNLAS